MDPAMEFEARALCQQKPMLEATQRGDSEVQEFYAGTTVLVTGFSGFLGKQLVEKLLRSCPQIKRVYLLLREKKGVDIQTRLANILQDPVFDAVRNQQPRFVQKLVVIPGDTSQLGLGLSNEDRNIITKEVEIIIHAAATTRFDDPLSLITNTNLRGTREMLYVAKECHKLKAFVYVSTAYSGATSDLIDKEVLEQFYASPVDPNALIDLVNSMDENVLVDITPKLIKGWPNTYTFVKRVAEEVVKTQSDGLPLCLVRPTIVIGTYSEPSPGWLETSCAYGASGVLIGTGLGLVHMLLADANCTVDLVPADIVNNLVIVAGWETARRFQAGRKDHRIYTIGSSNRNPIKFATIKYLAEAGVPREIAHSAMAPYYILCFNSKYMPVAFLLSCILHFIPGYFVDGILCVMGKPPILTKLYSKAWKLNSTLSPFLINQWTFKDNNTRDLFYKLRQTDRDLYNFDVTTFDWDQMMAIWILGIRKYIVKDGLKDTEYGMKKQIWLKYVNYVIVTVYAWMWWKVLSFGFWILSFIFRI